MGPRAYPDNNFTAEDFAPSVLRISSDGNTEVLSR
jgi:hypothetical protein